MWKHTTRQQQHSSLAILTILLLPFALPQILQITKTYSKFAPPDSLDDNLSNTTSLQDCSHTPPKSMVSIWSRKRECQTEALLRN